MINNVKARMGNPKMFQTGISRSLTGWLALCLLILINFQAVFVSAALWIAQEHGHDHQIVVQTDGDHFDVRLSHNQDHPSTEHHHESSLGLIAFIFSTHDHDGSDHVLHFNLSETPDQIRQRNLIAPSTASSQPAPIAPLSAPTPFLVSAPRPTFDCPATSPPLSAGRIGLRTTVLLI